MLHLGLALNEFARGLIYSFIGFHSDKMFHQYNTRVNQQKKMDHLEKENRELHEEVTTLRDNYERLTAMMETLVAAQN